MKLLQIDSSARASSVTRRLTAQFAQEWKKEHPEGEVIHRDLTAAALPLITDDWGATYLDESKLTPDQRLYLADSDRLIAELQAADSIVIGAPMYNYTISAPLKSWIDHVVRAGKTVIYGANGPEGRLQGKKVVVVTARGGGYQQGTGREVYDFQEPYLRHILGYIGITDVTFIHAENQSRGEANASLAAAVERVGKAAAAAF